jgi:hypothetical protein
VIEENRRSASQSQQFGGLTSTMPSQDLLISINEHGSIEAEGLYAPGDRADLRLGVLACITWVGMEIRNQAIGYLPVQDSRRCALVNGQSRFW